MVNPPEPENGLASRAATSPALFNRGVLDWFGDWSDHTFYQVGMESLHILTLDLDLSSYSPPRADIFPIISVADKAATATSRPVLSLP